MADTEIRREWGTILAATIGVMASCITLVNYSLGVFVVPLSDEFGWSRRDIAFATTCVTVGALLTSFVVGWLADRVNVGWLIVVSQALFGIAFCALGAFTNSLPVFYGIYLSMAFIAGGTLPITFTKIVAARVVQHRGLAIGLTLAGTGLAGFMVPPVVGYFVNTYGWRWGYVAVAAFPLCLAMPLSFIFLRKALVVTQSTTVRSTNYGTTLAEAVRTRQFWTLVVALFVASGAATAISANAVPLLIDRGLAPQTAANLAGLYGLAVIAGRIIVGTLADRFWAPPIAFAFLAPAALASVLMVSIPLNVPLAGALCIVLGLATGAEGDLLSYLVTRYFGIKSYGQIFSCIFVAFIAAIAIAAPLSGWAFDLVKSYTPVMLGAAVGWIACGLLFLTLGPYPSWPNEEKS
jgi:MFS family permease